MANKEKLTVQPSVKRKALRKASHHHTPRSPQKTKQKPIEIVTDDEEVVETFTQIEAAEEVVLPHIDVSPADAEQVAEELHTPHYVPPVAVRPQRLCLKRRISENSSIFDEALGVNDLARVSYIISILHTHIYVYTNLVIIISGFFHNHEHHFEFFWLTYIYV